MRKVVVAVLNSEDKKKNIIKTVALIVGVLAIIAVSFAYNYSEQKNTHTNSEYVEYCVHVKGAVENSGLYYVPAGTRVNELDNYAHFLPNADLEGVNLAEYVKDGSEIYIPYKGTAQSGAVNLNTVTYEELLEVDGIGETYARKIMNYRTAHGSFEKVIELKSILGTKTYESLREKFYVD